MEERTFPSSQSADLQIYNRAACQVKLEADKLFHWHSAVTGAIHCKSRRQQESSGHVPRIQAALKHAPCRATLIIS